MGQTSYIGHWSNYSGHHNPAYGHMCSCTSIPSGFHLTDKMERWHILSFQALIKECRTFGYSGPYELSHIEECRCVFLPLCFGETTQMWPSSMIGVAWGTHHPIPVFSFLFRCTGKELWHVWQWVPSSEALRFMTIGWAPCNKGYSSSHLKRWENVQQKSIKEGGPCSLLHSHM